MKGIDTFISALSATIGGFLGWFLGGMDGLVYALIVFVVVDYISGVMVAVLGKKLSSKVGFRGIFKKVTIFCLVGIGSIIDEQILKGGSALRTAIIFFYIANEGISIIENASIIGLPVPKKLKQALKGFNGDQDDE